MKLLATALLLFNLLFLHALANRISGPAQALFLYQVYCAEFQVYGNAQNGQIAPDCAKDLGTLQKCNLNQFLSHIEHTGARNAWTSTIPSGTTTDGFADPETNMRELFAAGYSANTDLKKLYPYGPKVDKSFLNAYGSAIDRLMELRSRFGDSLFGTKLDQIFHTWDLVAEARRVDMASSSLANLRQHLANKGSNIQVVSRSNPGTSYFAGAYQEIDTTAMLSATRSGSDLRAEITSYYNNGHITPANNKDAATITRHTDAIRVCENYSTYLRSACF